MAVILSKDGNSYFHIIETGELIRCMYFDHSSIVHKGVIYHINHCIDGLVVTKVGIDGMLGKHWARKLTGWDDYNTMSNIIPCNEGYLFLISNATSTMMVRLDIDGGEAYIMRAFARRFDQIAYDHVTGRTWLMTTADNGCICLCDAHVDGIERVIEHYNRTRGVPDRIAVNDGVLYTSMHPYTYPMMYNIDTGKLIGSMGRIVAVKSSDFVNIMISGYIMSGTTSLYNTSGRMEVILYDLRTLSMFTIESVGINDWLGYIPWTMFF